MSFVAAVTPPVEAPLSSLRYAKKEQELYAPHSTYCVCQSVARHYLVF